MTRGLDGDGADGQPPAPGRLVHVTELLAAHGRPLQSAGRRHRRPDPDEPAAEHPTPLEHPKPTEPVPTPEPVPAPTTTTAPAPSGSAAREWVMVGGQLGLALVAGAALWFGFRWLWAGLPVLALVLSLVVTVALVAVVRVLRKAEDFVSTLLAVLAGLVVTVSPPVLTLTGH